MATLPDMTSAARKAVDEAIAAGADGLSGEMEFWAHVRRVLGIGFYTKRAVIAECDARMKKARDFPEAISLRTLREAAIRRV